MDTDDIELGPIDYLLVEWPGKQPEGEIAPHLVDLVDRGLIRILDLAFLVKGEDGTIAAMDIADVGGGVAELAIFEGASSGLLDDEDSARPARRSSRAPRPRCWSTRTPGRRPFAAAVRRSGGQLVASGRIPVNDVLAALDAVEAAA